MRYARIRMPSARIFVRICMCEFAYDASECDVNASTRITGDANANAHAMHMRTSKRKKLMRVRYFTKPQWKKVRRESYDCSLGYTVPGRSTLMGYPSLERDPFV